MTSSGKVQNVSILDFIAAKGDGGVEVVMSAGDVRFANLQLNPHKQ